ncbi:MAG: hypothetical protein NC254_02305 [bacterium]|nr:hypothetical protein [bacterium]
MKERIAKAPELFLVAIDKETEKNIMILGLDVLPEAIKTIVQDIALCF